MKKYLIAIIVLSCLSINGFAQESGPDWGRDPWTIITHGTSTPLHIVPHPKSLLSYNHSAYRRGKRYIKVPCAISLRLAEVVVDPETNVSTARWIDGSEYVGDIRKGVIKGKGTMKYSDGGKYIGNWSEGRRWGVGLMHYSNGDMYSGEWMWDLPHGKGTFITAEGIAMKGRFQNGVPHGKFIMQAPDGSKYSARLIHGQIKEKSIKPYKEE